MKINDINLRKSIQRILLKEDLNKKNVDPEKAREDTNQEALDAIEILDPQDTSQKLFLGVVKGKIKVYVRKNNKNLDISPESEEFHNVISVIVNSVFDSGEEANIDLVKKYLEKMYPEEAKKNNGVRNLFRKYLKITN